MLPPPSAIDTLFQQAWAAQTAGRAEEAAAIYCRILANSEHASAWLGLGQCYLDLKQTTEALAAFRQAAVHMPDSGAIRHMVDMLAGTRVPDRAPDDYVLWVFNGHAESFDAHLTALNYRGPEMIATLAGRAWPRRPDRAILDLGCGTGLNGPIFREWASRLDGVDLAPRMLQQAARREVYDQLYKAEVHTFLRHHPYRYDAILSTDVFIYIGRLEEFFDLSYQMLNENGEILCTIELNNNDQPVQLMSTGRFRQSDSYICKAATAAGFAIVGIVDNTLRIEQGQPERGRAYHFVRQTK
ncbi:methyltransferase domain-containing protein [Ferrovibrio sp.]|uniref:class I SAM-dependent DNA methyltransferase n=1 Tax=Ferrovibrio sp. TaxID=1917215 RepID=UPI0026125C63|nr:methyltransferase domain-containing protein [Ferrovibrio sp.]